MRKKLGILRGRWVYLTIKQQVLTRFLSDLENRRPRKEFSYLTAVFSCVMSDYRDKPRLHSERESNRLQNRKFLSGMKEKTSPQQGWLNRERNCPERLLDLHPWRHKELNWTKP